jgi:hypothetical protein
MPETHLLVGISSARWLFREARPLVSTLDDARLVFAAVARAPMCPECIIRETAMTRARLRVVLSTMDASLSVSAEIARCARCLATKRVFRLTEPN